MTINYWRLKYTLEKLLWRKSRYDIKITNERMIFRWVITRKTCTARTLQFIIVECNVEWINITMNKHCFSYRVEPSISVGIEFLDNRIIIFFSYYYIIKIFSNNNEDCQFILASKNGFFWLLNFGDFFSV